jgi:hypothetical protein
MAYDETLALRIKAELQTRAAIAERKMLGGPPLRLAALCTAV